jgi:NMD protein affecting ribosome stability and mRNA decay
MDKSSYGRRDRLVQEKKHDMYRESGKWPEPTLCTQCQSIFQNGRWVWADVPQAKVHSVTCPACQRIADNYPAGYVELKGDFFIKNRQEIGNLILNEEKLEKSERPQERIMAIDEDDNSTMITTTGVHIARRVGEAISRAYKGDLVFTYGDGEKSIRVAWNR